MIYVKFKKPDTVKEFLALFYQLSTNRYYSVETFFDEECAKTQCNYGRNRSFDDLFEIVNTYFSVSVEELLHELLTMGIENRNPYIFTCFDIQKDVFAISGSIYENTFSYEGLKSKYKWKEILPLIGINTYGDLCRYVKNNKNKTQTA